jgi:hypothetical protein
MGICLVLVKLESVLVGERERLSVGVPRAETIGLEQVEV